MFISLYNKLKELNFSKKVYFAKLDNNDNLHNTNKNYEYRLNLLDSYILPDFFIPDIKLIIEFDGTYYHRNTVENKKRERDRDKNIKKAGYNVIHVNEKEYLSNKELVVSKLINIILSYNVY
jgi:very-short-patch-repair endonuclease